MDQLRAFSSDVAAVTNHLDTCNNKPVKHHLTLRQWPSMIITLRPYKNDKIMVQKELNTTKETRNKNKTFIL